VENWQAEADEASARWHRTDCEFIRGGESGNIPIGNGIMIFVNFVALIHLIRKSRKTIC